MITAQTTSELNFTIVSFNDKIRQ